MGRHAGVLPHFRPHLFQIEFEINNSMGEDIVVRISAFTGAYWSPGPGTNMLENLKVIRFLAT